MTEGGKGDYFADEAVRTKLAGLVCLSACGIVEAQTVKAPAYTETSIIDYATARPGLLTLNSLGVIHGQNLSFITRMRLQSDLTGGRYPNALPEANVSVKVRGTPAPVEFASPNLIIFVVPTQAAPGAADVQVVRQGVAGPKVAVELRAEMPLIYPAEEGFLMARHAASGDWIETSSPARPGEEVLLYAGGLGRLVPPLREMQPPLARLSIEKALSLRVALNGIELDRQDIPYAGALPGYAGVFEVRVRLPLAVDENPEVRLSLDGVGPAQTLRLPLRFSSPQPEAPLSR